MRFLMMKWIPNMPNENKENEMAITPTPDASTYAPTIETEAFSVEDRPVAASSATSSAIVSGWDAAAQLVTQVSDFPTEFRHTEAYQLIKFIDVPGKTPFASYKQHFLNGKTEGRRSYVCLGANCPLCNTLGDRPESKRAFTIVNLTSKPFTRQLLIATPRLFTALHNAELSPQGPLNRDGRLDKDGKPMTPVYWSINRTGVKQQTLYNLVPVKGRDLQEDYGITEAEISAALAEFQPYGIEAIRQDSYQTLVEVAESLL